MLERMLNWLLGPEPHPYLSEEQRRRIERDDELRETYRRLQLATGREPSVREIWAATPPVLRGDTKHGTLTT